MRTLRVLLADDHTVVRRGLRKILESAPEVQVVGEVGDGAAAVASSLDLQPDVVLMDVSMPVMNGIEATRKITSSCAKIYVLILSMHADQQYVEQSIAAGAHGYLVKDADDDDLVNAIKTVSRGERYLSPMLGYSTSSLTPPVPKPEDDPLSPRETQVLSLIATGLSNRAIAGNLGISVHTVDTHRKHIMEKLDLHSTAELVRYALRRGLVT